MPGHGGALVPGCGASKFLRENGKKPGATVAELRVAISIYTAAKPYNIFDITGSLDVNKLTPVEPPDRGALELGAVKRTLCAQSNWRLEASDDWGTLVGGPYLKTETLNPNPTLRVAWGPRGRAADLGSEVRVPKPPGFPGGAFQGEP